MVNIGKILFVDDVFDDDVIKKAVLALMEKGMPVQFWNGKGDFPETICNVRVVVLDLDLSGFGSRSAGEEFYYPAAEALHKIPGPFVAVIMAIDFNEDDPENLDAYCREHYPSLSGFIAREGLRKDEELEDPSHLERLIVSTIKKEKIFTLLLLWEGVVDRAKDNAFSDLIVKDIKSAISALVKSLCRDMGEEAAARELISIMMRLVSRNACDLEEFKELSDHIKELNVSILKGKTEYPCEDDLLLYNRLMFYKPKSTERVWTGDIYRTEGLPKYDKYAIVLTPACDIVQGKTKKVLTCFAFPLHEKYFDDSHYPPNKIDPAVLRKKEKGEKQKNIIEFLKDRYLIGKIKLPENFHPIWNFKDEEETLGICFNFNNVRSIGIEVLQKWKRVSRLDSPFIEQILQKYGEVVSRVGVLEINRSPEQFRTSVDRFV